MRQGQANQAIIHDIRLVEHGAHSRRGGGRKGGVGLDWALQQPSLSTLTGLDCGRTDERANERPARFTVPCPALLGHLRADVRAYGRALQRSTVLQYRTGQ